MHQVVPLAIKGHVPDVILVAEHQPRLDFVFAFARFLVSGAFVVRLGALAVKRARCIGTLLRARSPNLQNMFLIKFFYSHTQK